MPVPRNAAASIALERQEAHGGSLTLTAARTMRDPIQKGLTHGPIDELIRIRVGVRNPGVVDVAAYERAASLRGPMTQ